MEKGIVVKNYEGSTPVKGKTGMIDFSPSKYGNVMFYPDDKVPYRICLPINYVKVKKGE